MTLTSSPERNGDPKETAIARFAQALGLTTVPSMVELIGGREFLKFKVGRNAPVYAHALRETQNRIPEDNPYRGLLGLSVEPQPHFPTSIEAGSCVGFWHDPPELSRRRIAQATLLSMSPFRTTKKT